jgi:hypothetical protein
MINASGTSGQALNCSAEDVALAVGAGKFQSLGGSNANAGRLISSLERIALLADREWLEEATKTIGQF